MNIINLLEKRIDLLTEQNRLLQAEIKLKQKILENILFTKDEIKTGCNKDGYWYEEGEIEEGRFKELAGYDIMHKTKNSSQLKRT